MIKLTNLQKIYRTKEIETVALENVNLEVQQGEFLSIMGPSGSWACWTFLPPARSRSTE